MASRVTADGFVEITTPIDRLAGGTRYRIISLDDEPGRPPTPEEMAAGGMSQPPPKNWQIRKDWSGKIDRSRQGFASEEARRERALSSASPMLGLSP